MPNIVASAAVLSVMISAVPAGAQFDDAPQTPPGPKYRTEVVAKLRETLNDPTSVRDASITEPFLMRMPAARRYVVCLKFRSKNSFGAYHGLNEYLAIFYRGRIAPGNLERAGINDCDGRKYSRFPEAEKIKF